MFALYVEVIRVQIRREIKNRLATMLRGPACSNASGRRIGPLPGKVGNRATGHILSPLRAAQAAGVPSPEYVHLGVIVLFRFDIRPNRASIRPHRANRY